MLYNATKLYILTYSLQNIKVVNFIVSILKKIWGSSAFLSDFPEKYNIYKIKYNITFVT